MEINTSYDLTEIAGGGAVESAKIEARPGNPYGPEITLRTEGEASYLTFDLDGFGHFIEDLQEILRLAITADTR
jgi:hypothetical protein